ncbi:M4 family metallopeptidase [Clostridium oryzae]|uniref:Neutral metalloproteinase n=1 Tax=Clostridium oryzae TaxID=1450648 RepID=A0A1V4IMM7_9CLOT|nr:M4 family metallopeptidase [Clostridium oryzae]OPJ60747.1 bacillolysin precursor [Clostridium oryzae]
MKRKFAVASLSIILFGTSINSLSLKAADPIKSIEKRQAIQRLEGLSNGKLKMYDKNGQLFLSGQLSKKQKVGKKAAIDFLQNNKSILGIENASSDLEAVKTKNDNKHTYVKFVQVINGIKVDNTCLNVHFNRKGYITSVNGNLEKFKEIKSLGGRTISAEDAVSIAKKQYSYDSLRFEPKAEEVIVNKNGINYQVYKVNISFMKPNITNHDVYVEVHSGKVIKTENNIRMNGPITGSGVDVFGKKRKLSLYRVSEKYKMKDVTRDGTEGILTYNLNNKTSGEKLVSSTKKAFSGEKYKAPVSAHYNAGSVIDFYRKLFDRDSLDDEGMPIVSYTHYKKKFNNAFWDGYEMIYGDGDGKKFTYLSGDLGIVAHEMTHGVISNTADLEYHNESGSLNESIADVFGVLISTYDKYKVSSGGKWKFNKKDWVIGDGVYTPRKTGDALRSLADPTLYEQPDNMDDYVYCDDVKEEDWGGVHLNSGIPNKAAYLIAKKIGMEKTAKIYYRALVEYMNPSTDFEDAKNCLLQAAEDLYGEKAEVQAISVAFDSVGIY